MSYPFTWEEVGERVGADETPLTQVEKEFIALEWNTNHEKSIATKYLSDRSMNYPELKEQLDMQYHDQLDGTTTWKDAIAKVKEDNPKPKE